MVDLDVSDLTDEDLGVLARTVESEQAKRRAIANIPDQIVRLRQQYIDNGGDPSDLES